MPFLYDLRGATGSEIRQFVREIETDVELWEENIPPFLRQMSQPGQYVEGASSLHLSLLSLKMLTCRLSLVVRTSKLVEQSVVYR